MVTVDRTGLVRTKIQKVEEEMVLDADSGLYFIRMCLGYQRISTSVSQTFTDDRPSKMRVWKRRCVEVLSQRNALDMPL
jgi:hypothetical protein